MNNEKSNSISKTLELNDSDIENEFNMIKNSKPNNNQNKVNANSVGTHTMGTKMNHNFNKNFIKKSPKPIPKGIDFGQDLIGNPRYFSKNNSANSTEVEDGLETNQQIQNNEKDKYMRMPNPPTIQKQISETELDSVSGYSDDKDELISDDYTDENDSSNNNNESTNYNSEKYKSKMNHSVPFNKYQEMTQNEIYARKEELLIELEKLEEKGIKIDTKYNIQSDIFEMERTYLRLKNKKEQSSAIKLMKKVLMGIVSGTEYINQKFNRENIDLDGWAENVLINISDYDEIFEELYDKYKTKFAIAPEIKLFMTLIGSAFTFHMSKVLASKFSNSQPSINKSNNYNNNSYNNNNNSYNNNNNNNSYNNNNLYSDPNNFTGTSQDKSKINPNSFRADGLGSNKNTNLTKNLGNLFSESKNLNKKNDDLDEIIKELERNQNNQNNLEIPDDRELDDLNEILSDSNQNEFSELNEIQFDSKKKSKNLIL
jgi:hypothetical protein